MGAICSGFLIFDFNQEMLKLKYSSYRFEAGTDEAGRGCLAGPVVAAAVILPDNFSHELLNDSKQLSEKKRQLLRPVIEKEALTFGVAFIDHKEIDQINILKASILAMHRSLDKLSFRPEFISVDGNKFLDYGEVPFKAIVKGDGKYMNIAAASVLAKTYRDEYMEELDGQFPIYQWKKNKGYPTRAHRKAIQEVGPCEHHRMSFNLLPAQMKLDL